MVDNPSARIALLAKAGRCLGPVGLSGAAQKARFQSLGPVEAVLFKRHIQNFLMTVFKDSHHFSRTLGSL